MIGLGVANIGRARLTVAVAAAVTLALAIASLGIAGRLAQSTFLVHGTPSERAWSELNKHFGIGTSFAVLLQGRPAELRRQGLALTNVLARQPNYSVISPWTGSKAANLRPNPNSAVVVVTLNTPVRDKYREKPVDIAERMQTLVDQHIRPGVRASITGPATVGLGLRNAALSSTKLAELIAAPVLIVVLLFVFRSLAAAMVPLVVGGAGVACAYGVLSLLTPYVAIDAFATEMASLIGLALGVDYSLLLVSRFREELSEGLAPHEAAARSARTAGRTVISAGALLVVAMVMAVAVLPPGVLFSAVVGVLVVTVVSVLLAVLVLPSGLALMGTNIERWPIGRRRRARGGVLGHVIARGPLPLAAVLPLLVVLGLLALPATELKAATPGPDLLPTANRQRQDYDRFAKTLGPGWTTPFYLLAVADRGSIAKPDVLRRLQVAQEKLGRDRAVSSVSGAGSLASALSPLGQASRGLRSATGQLRNAKSNLGKLDTGLSRAAGGATALQSGVDQLRSGSQQIHAGDLRAANGSEQLANGLSRAFAGSRALDRGLKQAADGVAALESGSRTASKGAGRLTRAVKTIRASVRTGAVQVKAFPPSLRRGSEDLGRLRQPAQTAQQQLELALQKLRTMSVGKTDPNYEDAYRAVATSAGAVTGRNPEDGSQVAPGYQGMDASLAIAESQLAGAAGDADRIVSGFGRLNRALTKLYGGSSRLRTGIARLRAGAARLDAGLAKLDGGSGRLTGGIGALSDGSGRLVSGINRLADGSSQLSSGLDRGSAGSMQLAGGLRSMHGRVSRYASSLPATGGLDQLTTQAPRLFDSSYLALAALDGGPAALRNEASFVVDIDRGGSAARIIVLPKHDLTNPATKALRGRLNRTARQISAGHQATAYVAGEAAVNLDYRDVALSRLVLFVVLLTLVSYLVLVVILRSLLLPLFAVLLNLLTILAAVGVTTLLFEGKPALLGGPGYIDVISLAGMFAVTSALSIDYEVFLLARMREGFLASGSTNEGIRYGLSHTARVITGAAVIMIAVFAVFAITDFITIRELGVALVVAIAIDATVMRLFILPAIMQRCGRRVWWLPRFIDRKLPKHDHDRRESPVRPAGALNW